jgi:hypothetical protein
LPVLESDNIQLMSPESGDGIRPPSLESGQQDSDDQSGRIPAGWPNGFGQIRPDGRNPATFTEIQLSQIPTKLSGF